MNPTAQLLNSRAEPAGSVSGAEESAGHPDGVRATARIHATYNGRVTTLTQLRSDGPFHLRRMRTDGHSAKVGIIGAMSAPSAWIPRLSGGSDPGVFPPISA